MIYQDRAYGEFTIDEPVILDLIASPAMQRLKHIDQGGYSEVRFPGMKNDRFEHSLGVYLLLKMFNAPLPEQVAGLIHDISHSAFSHCIDYALPQGSEKEQSHQDNVFIDYIKRTDIPRILERHGFDINYLTDDNNFPLKEKELPELCADRLDYSLRQLIIFQFGGKAEVENLLASLKVIANNWVFCDFAAARKYAEYFRQLNDRHYSGPPTAHMFRTCGDYLRRGLEQNYITAADLYTTDEEVLAKMRLYHGTDAELKRLFARMNNETKWEVKASDYNAHVWCKSRIVDPLCLHQNEIKRVSDIDESWQEVVARLLQPKEYFLKFYD